MPTCPACFAPLVVYRIQTGGDKHGVSLPADRSVAVVGVHVRHGHGRLPSRSRSTTAFVDYDISSVDQVYLSVAMDPVNNPFIGFIGSVLRRDIFSDRLTKFRNDFGWPKYKWPAYVTNQTAIRLPATFNVMNEIAHPGAPPPFEPAGAAIKDLPVIQKMKDLWDEMLRYELAEPALPEAPTIVEHMQQDGASGRALREELRASYKKLCATPVGKLDRDQMMANVYGWVPFNGCPSGDVNNELKDTPGIGGAAGYHKISNAYVDLQYTSPPDPKTFGDFNRYTELIHSTEYLHVGEYAFSIDDAAGNMLEVGDGVNITVGGAQRARQHQSLRPVAVLPVQRGSGEGDRAHVDEVPGLHGPDARNCSVAAPNRDMKESDRKNGPTSDMPASRSAPFNARA